MPKGKKKSLASLLLLPLDLSLPQVQLLPECLCLTTLLAVTNSQYTGDYLVWFSLWEKRAFYNLLIKFQSLMNLHLQDVAFTSISVPPPEAQLSFHLVPNSLHQLQHSQSISLKPCPFLTILFFMVLSFLMQKSLLIY